MAKKKQIILPSIITEQSWFYKDNEELLKPYLGSPYISYSSVSSWEDYKDDFIKQKFMGLKLPSSIYGDFGTYTGAALEDGKFPEYNPHGFTGQENMNFDELRPKNAEYEKMIVIPREDYIIIGFIDRYTERTEDKIIKAHIRDQKTGGKGKENQYSDKKYTQVILYAHAIENMGIEIEKTDVWFIRRTGSHLSPPLHISDEQFEIPLEYNEKRVKYALDKVDRVVNEISDLYQVYQKYFS